jgi:sensor c-di-GMP phosphodiesterase-like protein
MEFGDVLRYHVNFRVSINIVASDLYDQSFHQTLYAYIEDQDIQPGQIALELTEPGASQMAAADIALQQLRRIGYKVYIDDFGTGSASLAGLSSQSVDALKLDISFTNTVGTGAARARLVPSIMAMAHEIGIPVIVEGVETTEQADLFRDHGAWAMQGWLHGKPGPAHEVMRRVERIS